MDSLVSYFCNEPDGLGHETNDPTVAKFVLFEPDMIQICLFCLRISRQGEALWVTQNCLCLKLSKCTEQTSNPRRLQYIKAYQGKCDDVGGSNAKKPADSELADTFAPNCGVESATLSPITGRVLGCQSEYVNPEKAFTDILTMKNRSASVIYNTTHTEVGAAVSGSDGGGPYFWCLLFSNGKSNSTFQLEGGEAKITRPGCFSGANDTCSGADGWSQNSSLLTIFAGIFTAICYLIVV